MTDKPTIGDPDEGPKDQPEVDDWDWLASDEIGEIDDESEA